MNFYIHERNSTNFQIMSINAEKEMQGKLQPVLREMRAHSSLEKSDFKKQKADLENIYLHHQETLIKDIEKINQTIREQNGNYETTNIILSIIFENLHVSI